MFQSFCCLTAAGVTVTWVLWSVTTKQENRNYHGECRDKVAPPQLSSRWGRASDPGRGQARSQQLLLEGEVIHHQVIGQVWEEGQWKICHGGAKIQSQKQHTCGKSVLMLLNDFRSCSNNAPQMSRDTDRAVQMNILLGVLKCLAMWQKNRMHEVMS